jgi:phage portal protein BeeE
MTLLGIPGDNTYANYQEANRTFWRQVLEASKSKAPAPRQPRGKRRPA